jgi:DNA adenine methylase
MPKHNEIELAGAFLFLNRTSYSGILKAGPLGGKNQASKYKIDCRFNKIAIAKKISEIARLEDKIHIVESDGLEFMKKMATASVNNPLFYVDPPYYGAGKLLYRHYFEEQDHVNLSHFLKFFNLPWLLSYDNAEFIKNLYEGSQSFFVYTHYHSGHFKKGVKELLISNKPIPPFKSVAVLNNYAREQILL